MLAELEQLVAEISARNSKLILLVGPPGSGKSRLLRQLGAKLDNEPVSTGVEVGRRLASTPTGQRGFLVAELLRDVAAAKARAGLLLLDNLEVLFEPSLQVNPLDLLKQLAHSRPVVAIWPGELRGGRLLYADVDHPEHRDYALNGVVVVELSKS